MPVRLDHDADEEYLSIHLSGKLSHHDFQQYIPELAELIRRHGPLRVLVELHGFQGWTEHAWEDVKFDVQHFEGVSRIAIVGEATWRKGTAAFTQPFINAEIREFEHEDLDQARDWLLAESPRAGGS